MRLHAALLFALALPALACTCRTVEPFCNARPDFTDTRTALFVGVVQSVYPSGSRQDYQSSLVPPLLRWSPFTTELEDYRDGYLRMLRDVLTPEEEDNIRRAQTVSNLMRTMMDTLWTGYPRRVQFAVTETFSGPASGTFELFTGSGGGDCGIGFKPGDTYLVEATRNPRSNRWHASSCGHTQSIPYAAEEIAALRAWKKGESPKRSVFGVISAESPAARNLQLKLTAGKDEAVTASGPGGEFHFSGLAPKVYRLDASAPIWSFGTHPGPHREIDLTKSNCVQLFLHTAAQQP